MSRVSVEVGGVLASWEQHHRLLSEASRVHWLRRMSGVDGAQRRRIADAASARASEDRGPQTLFRDGDGDGDDDEHLAPEGSAADEARRGDDEFSAADDILDSMTSEIGQLQRHDAAPETGPSGPAPLWAPAPGLRRTHVPVLAAAK
jgi:hypothetical protein